MSGIQPGQGTEGNENLHRYINRCLLVGSTTVGPELAIAVLTILFYTLNSKKVGEKHSSNSRIVPVEPIENQQRKSNEQLNDFHMKTSNVSSCPDGRWRKTKANNCGDVGNVGGAILVNTGNIEEICNDESILGMLMKQTNQLLNVLSKIGQNFNNRAVDIFDMSFFQLGARLLPPLETAEQDEHCEMLKRNISAFDLDCDEVPADGDCAFVSIMTELHKCVTSPSFEEGQYLEHLEILDLGMPDINADEYQLRQLFDIRVQSEPEYLGLLGLSPSFELCIKPVQLCFFSLSSSLAFSALQLPWPTLLTAKRMKEKAVSCLSIDLLQGMKGTYGFGSKTAAP